MTYGDFESTILADAAFPVNFNRRWSAKIVEFAVLEWAECPEWLSYERFERELVHRVKNRVRAAINPLLLVVLMAALSALVQKIVAKIIDWWLKQPEERGALIWRFQDELDGSWKSGDQ